MYMYLPNKRGFAQSSHFSPIDRVVLRNLCSEIVFTQTNTTIAASRMQTSEVEERADKLTR